MKNYFNYDNTLKLSSFSQFYDVLEHDGLFFSTAKIPTILSNKLVAISSMKYLREMHANLEDISCVICNKNMMDEMPDHIGVAISNSPIESLWRIHEEIVKIEGYLYNKFESIISPSSSIHSSASIANSNVIIGDNCIISENTSISTNTIIGNNVYIGPNTVIGSPGYEIQNIDNTARIWNPAGGVLINDNVIILSGVTIAKSAFPTYTILNDSVSLDNLVHIAHDCILDKHVKIAAGTTLSGRVNVGERTFIGPGAVISNGISIGADAFVSLGSVVIKNMSDNERVTGNFAYAHRAFMSNFKKLIS